MAFERVNTKWWKRCSFPFVDVRRFTRWRSWRRRGHGNNGLVGFVYSVFERENILLGVSTIDRFTRTHNGVSSWNVQRDRALRRPGEDRVHAGSRQTFLTRHVSGFSGFAKRFAERVHARCTRWPEITYDNETYRRPCCERRTKIWLITV